MTAERFEDLPLESRVDVIYEREVYAETLVNAVTWSQTTDMIALECHPSDLVRYLPGWYAILDAEGDLVCLVPPGGIDKDAHADDVAGSRASVVAEMLNRKTPSEPIDGGHLRLVTSSAVVRRRDDDGAMWLLTGGRRMIDLCGRSFRSVTLMCTFEDLQDADLMVWLHNDVATRLESGGKLTLQVV